MAATLLLRRVASRRHPLSNNFIPFSNTTSTASLVFPLPSQRRHFSDSKEKEPDLHNEPPTKRTKTPSPIRIVSYDVKPEEKVPADAPPPPVSPRILPEPKADFVEGREMKARSTFWTREDTRYIKDIPSISPVSYPTKTAPLPEDRVVVSEEEVGQSARSEYAVVDENRRRIAATRRVLSRVSAAEEEEVPFPTLIKLERKEARKAIYDLQEAIREVKASAVRNFTETVEAHVKLAINMRRTDLTVRGVVSLPHGTGKVVKVAVFADGTAADEARAAGADIVGGVELVDEIKNSKEAPAVDWCISTELFMDNLKKISMILRSLMPNPRKGSVTNDVGAAVKEVKKGFIEFKMDKTAIVHVGLGKVNLAEESLQENIGAFVNALLLAKPAGLKKTSRFAGYVNSFHLCSTMGPGFRVSMPSLATAVDRYNKLHPH